MKQRDQEEIKKILEEDKQFETKQEKINQDDLPKGVGDYQLMFRVSQEL